ncbi:MAG: DUF1622 domain-containing protein [Nakamurella sp.]
MQFIEVMELITRGFEAIGAAVLVVGLIWSFVLALRVWRRTKIGSDAYQALRRSLGGVLLLGLEILVAADLVRTVAIEPTLDNVAVLGLIVIIRTVLSFSLEIEIEGVAPWRRATTSGASYIAAAARSAGSGTAASAKPPSAGNTSGE